MALMLSVDNAFRAHGRTVTSEAVVGDFLLRMILAEVSKLSE